MSVVLMDRRYTSWKITYARGFSRSETLLSDMTLPLYKASPFRLSGSHFSTCLVNHSLVLVWIDVIESSEAMNVSYSFNSKQYSR